MCKQVRLNLDFKLYWLPCMNYQIKLIMWICVGICKLRQKSLRIFGSMILSIQCHVTPWLILVFTLDSTLCNIFGLGNPTWLL